MTKLWDTYDAYLFDIDGTLLNCKDAVHYYAFCEALLMLSGKPLTLDGVVAHGNTDVGILRDALQLAGLPDALWRSRLPEACGVMCASAERNKMKFQAEVLPYVNEILEHLKAKGAVLGVATGNLAAIGKLKLQHCGLLPYWDFGGYSDGHEYRKDVFAAALRQARSLAGEHCTVCVVGDTPADVQAAHANGLDVIAVATGIYSREQLLAELPEWCITSFGELLIR